MSDKSEAAPPEPAPYDLRAGWTAVVIFLLLYALGWLDRKIIAFLVDPIRHSLHVTDFQVSLLQGVAAVIFYPLFALPIGWMVDRFSRRRIIFWGLIVWSMFAIASGLTKNFAQLLMARVGVSVGDSTLQPATSSALADLFPKEKLTTAMAVFGLGGILGSAIAVALSGVVVGFTQSSPGYNLPIVGFVEPWQFVFIVTGAPGLLMGFLLFLIPEPVRRRRGLVWQQVDGKGFGGAIGYMLAHKRFYLSHFIGFSAVAIMGATLTAWTPAHFTRTYGLPVAQVGLTMGAIQISLGAIGMAGPGFIIDRMIRRGHLDAHLWYFAFAAVVLGLSGIGMGLAPNAGSAFVGLAFLDLSVGYFPVAAAALQVVTPNRYRGQVTATFLIFLSVIGQGLGPSITAAFTDFLFKDDHKVGASIALTYAVCMPIAAVCLWYGRRGMRVAHEASDTA